MSTSLSTPCVGVCSTVFGDRVCRGCRRYSHEVDDWNRYTTEEKLAVYQRLNALSEQVIQNKVRITDQAILEKTLRLKGIRYNKHLSPYVWVYELLRAGASQLDDLSVYGIQALGPYQNHPIKELKALIDTELLTLATAHYERYIVVKPQVQGSF